MSTQAVTRMIEQTWAAVAVDAKIASISTNEEWPIDGDELAKATRVKAAR